MSAKFPKIFIFIAFFLIFSPYLGEASLVEEMLPSRVKVLLVPGHDDKSYGARYGNIKEADMNLALATQIYEILKEDNRLKVYISRDENGYIEEFMDFFENNKTEIASFLVNAKDKMSEKKESGEFVEKTNVPHNSASEDTVFKLYGINKWVNENKIDVVVHVHFNDYRRKNRWVVGNRKGFAIYMPDDQFSNFTPSASLADDLFLELKKKYKTSNYVNEIGGLVKDQKLIAVGANETLIPTAGSVLVEYGYIYEFRNSAVRKQAYASMAKLTAEGIQKYFFNR